MYKLKLWFNTFSFSTILITGFCNSETVETSRHYTGKGVATYPNGDIYDGYFKDGLRHGDNGTYTYNKYGNEEVKDTYKGAWVNNDKNGIGI